MATNPETLPANSRIRRLYDVVNLQAQKEAGAFMSGANFVLNEIGASRSIADEIVGELFQGKRSPDALVRLTFVDGDPGYIRPHWVGAVYDEKGVTKIVIGDSDNNVWSVKETVDEVIALIS